jgi:plastocyanin
MPTIRTITGSLIHLPTVALAIGAAWPCWAGTLSVRVVDGDGRPIGGVAVYAVPSKPSAPAAAHVPRPTAVMDQRHTAFVPHLLVVQTGTLVDFPNNDTVSHHVYSFSAAKTFELTLYKGDPHPPVLFDHPGVVVLGCNIHDSMLGYILVVDTPHFSLTDAAGKVELGGLGADDYTVTAWTPRARPKNLPASTAVNLGADQRAAIAFRIDGKLLPDHDHGDTSLTWERY